MFEMIDKKASELKALNPSNPEFKKWVDQSNLWYWLYFDLTMQDIKVTKRQVADILAGQLLEDAPMEIYGYIHRFAAVYRDMKNYLLMKSNLTVEMLDGWCADLFPETDEEGNQRPVRRTSTSAIYEWGHIPPHFREIKERMVSLLRSCDRQRFLGNYTDRMTQLYAGILYIYPYGDKSPIMAGVALIYCLLEEGLPVPSLSVGEQEYNKLVAEYMEHGNLEPLKNMLERSIYNRIEAVYQAALAASEE
ncbi:MAG: hypothetical protein MJ194_00280 [Clostridia bacterium]|nr:hypothetical protein [Clostridia bacterium]